MLFIGNVRGKLQLSIMFLPLADLHRTGYGSSAEINHSLVCSLAADCTSMYTCQAISNAFIPGVEILCEFQPQQPCLSWDRGTASKWSMPLPRNVAEGCPCFQDNRCSRFH